MLCVQDGRLARIAFESNVSISRVARYVDAYEFFVDSTPNVDRTARTHGVRGVLNRAPRCRLSAVIGIIPRPRHIEGGIGLAKSRAHAHPQNNKRQNFHADPPKKSTLPSLKHGSLRTHFQEQMSIELNQQMRIVS